jgi:acyl carrier protein/NAD(P)-dependent dehydrogenase (short-subunit alcohol dehydrogenase family)
VTTPAPATSGGLDVATLSSALLEIVSEKTGYPTEMLELEMDIEADLGIDSIKRVEILGAMRDQFPELPQLKAEDLGELRTLEEIVTYMRDHSGSANGNGASKSPAVETEVALPKVDANSGAGRSSLAKIDHDIPRSAAQWTFLPTPDVIDRPIVNGGVVLVTDDGSPLTARVVENLTQQNTKTVVLSFPSDVVGSQSDLPDGASRVMLPDMTEAQLQSALETIAQEHGEVAAFVHLNPAAQANGSFFHDHEKSLTKHVFLLAKHLKKPLNDSAEQGFGAFVTVARLDGCLGTSGKSFGAIAGGLFGLTKSLNLEWADVHCRAIDIEPTISPDIAADYVIAELYDPNRLLVETGYSAHGRGTLIAEANAARV